ncbi:DUF4159 domain-containing protein [Aureibaculum sp. A20]|uniref:DUF4159 domain-containing protein n=1 Tax=Aureibaculum flavum TaxID=2795986 RepID=A0ABS0WT48_9FLAO|nr:DUF4159 domain-containing protein [Aureibaculum flavum]MBJ2175138.1 DUF4159 domain-containing protein [Aureibaculum flavum]
MLRFLFLFLFLNASVYAQEVGILKYKGGGDWYANPTAVPNLIKFSNENINTIITEKPESVETNSIDIFNYPILFMTGHGNVFFDDSDIENLRKYLTSGGFLHISDNYGLDKYIRTELEKLFPESKLQEIPYTHPIYNQTYTFKSLPKIHEHDGKPAQGFGLFIEGRLVLFYDYESDLSDGWEDEVVHNNPAPVREKALQMGANIIEYVFKH